MARCCAIDPFQACNSNRLLYKAQMMRVYVFGPSRVFLFAALLFCCSLGNLTAKESPISAEMRVQVEEAIAKVRPALVRIRVVSAEYSEGREVRIQEVGSGAIITKDGYIITNHHVAGHARRMF
ncbi:MAG: hypothetical protein ABJC04_13905 [Verrucomicrobiota bacterium]